MAVVSSVISKLLCDMSNIENGLAATSLVRYVYLIVPCASVRS